MKRAWLVAFLILALGFADVMLFAQASRADDTIVTSAGTYKLLDPAKLVDATAVRSAVRTIELATIAAAADVNQAEKGVRGTQDKIARNNDAAAKMMEEARIYTAAAKNLKDRQDALDRQTVPLVQRLNDHNERVRANNSLPPEKRSPATIAALKAEETQLGTERGNNQKTQDGYNNEAIALNKQKADLVARGDAVDKQATQLDTEMAAMKLKLGKAYRQLQACADYSKQMKVLMAKYNVGASPHYIGVSSEAMGTLERLKELSGQAFGDNGPGKPALDPKDVKPPSRVTPN
jgi:chromosome segregation ATPase